MLSLTDQVGNVLYLPHYPKRIVSLVPSQTELLYHLGLYEEVVGITKFCVHPAEWFKTKTRVGGTKTVNIKKVSSLKPDLIIANKEENVQSQIEELKAFAPVYVSDIITLEDALQMMTSVGKLTGKDVKSAELVSMIKHKFDALAAFQHANTNSSTNLNTAYLIWKEPYMAAGSDTFINDMLLRCGLNNIFKNKPRYPAIEIGHLSQLNCQLLLLSSEPYPFKQKHLEELQKQLPHTKIMLVDGEMFSWYGSRLLHAADYFGKMIAHIQG